MKEKMGKKYTIMTIEKKVVDDGQIFVKFYKKYLHDRTTKSDTIVMKQARVSCNLQNLAII